MHRSPRIAGLRQLQRERRPAARLRRGRTLRASRERRDRQHRRSNGGRPTGLRREHRLDLRHRRRAPEFLELLAELLRSARHARRDDLRTGLGNRGRGAILFSAQSSCGGCPPAHGEADPKGSAAGCGASVQCATAAGALPNARGRCSHGAAVPRGTAARRPSCRLLERNARATHDALLRTMSRWLAADTALAPGIHEPGTQRHSVRNDGRTRRPKRDLAAPSVSVSARADRRGSDCRRGRRA